jgi:hypothetical protein
MADRPVAPQRKGHTFGSINGTSRTLIKKKKENEGRRKTEGREEGENKKKQRRERGRTERREKPRGEKNIKKNRGKKNRLREEREGKKKKTET